MDLGKFYAYEQFTKVPLTELQQQELIYNEEMRSKVDGMLQCSQTKGNPVRLGFRTLSRDSWFNTLHGLYSNIADSELKEWDMAYLNKWAPQGGCVKSDDIISLIERNYTSVKQSVDPSSHQSGLNYLLTRIDEAIALYGYPQPIPYTGYSRENSGAPFCLRKDDWRAEGRAIEQFFKPIHYPNINIPGTRNQRGSPRVIYFDAMENVAEISPILSAVRRWLRQYLPDLFSAWLNPARELAPRITRALQKGFWVVKGDYKKMDLNFGYPAVCTWVLPVYERLIPDQWEYLRFASFVENLYKQPLYMGDEIWCGPHDTFSGQTITNDFETVFSVIQDLTSVLKAREHPRKVVIAANGDDTNILARHTICQKIRDIWMEISYLAGLPPSEEKCGIGTSSQFCKMYRDSKSGLELRFNTDGLPYYHGAYPISLMLNSLINVEYPDKSPESNLVAALQILDNGQGSPYWRKFITRIWPLCEFAKGVWHKESLENVTIVDWWSKVYNETWRLENSPSAIYLQSIGQVVIQ